MHSWETFFSTNYELLNGNNTLQLQLIEYHFILQL